MSQVLTQRAELSELRSALLTRDEQIARLTNVMEQLVEKKANVDNKGFPFYTFSYICSVEIQVDSVQPLPQNQKTVAVVESPKHKQVMHYL